MALMLGGGKAFLFFSAFEGAFYFFRREEGLGGAAAFGLHPPTTGSCGGMPQQIQYIVFCVFLGLYAMPQPATPQPARVLGFPVNYSPRPLGLFGLFASLIF